MPKTTVKCALCGLEIEKTEAIRYKAKNYHFDCEKKQEEKDNLYDYVCKLFSLKAPGPRIYSQLKQYSIQHPEYTYKGIIQALEYFYVVQNKPKDKANGGIGIVPYVYDAAQEYYNKKEKRQERVAENIVNSLEAQPIIIKVKEKKQEKKEIYDLDNL